MTPDEAVALPGVAAPGAGGGGGVLVYGNGLGSSGQLVTNRLRTRDTSM